MRLRSALITFGLVALFAINALAESQMYFIDRGIAQFETRISDGIYRYNPFTGEYIDTLIDNRKIAIQFETSPEYIIRYGGPALVKPMQIAQKSNGNLLVVNFKRGNILEFTSDGELLGIFYVNDWILEEIVDITVCQNRETGENEVIVLNNESSFPNVPVFTEDGSYKRRFGHPYVMQYPHDFLIDDNGNLVMITQNRVQGFVQIWDPLGQLAPSLDIFDDRLVDWFAGPSGENGEAGVVHNWIGVGITKGPDNNYYITDWTNKKVRIYQSQPPYEYIGDFIDLSADNMEDPQRLTFGPPEDPQFLFVAASRQGVYKYDLEGNLLQVIKQRGLDEELGDIRRVKFMDLSTPPEIKICGSSEKRLYLQPSYGLIPENTGF
jgi:hypothetical protein